MAAPAPLPPPLPLSEDRPKVTDPWTAEECVAELRRIAEAEPDRSVTRNYFRVHGAIAESVWNRHFGTFAEFRRAADLVLSRHAHQLEREIAKHASKDRMRALGEEKAGYEGAYARPSGRRFQSVLVGSDQHDRACDPFHRRLFLDAAARLLPERIVLNGDLFDLPQFSRYTQDPRAFDLVARIEWVHAFLRDLRRAAPDSEITLVEGNHEFRLLRHLAEATPALMVVLADLHGMTVRSLLGLERFEVNYVARCDLAAFNEGDIKRELTRNYLVLHDCLLLHHFPEGVRMGYPGANGHHHRYEARHAYSPTFGPYQWVQTGCGRLRRADYCAAEQWSQGFLICHVDTATRRTAFEYVDTTHGHAVLGGRFYHRTPDEMPAP